MNHSGSGNRAVGGADLFGMDDFSSSSTKPDASQQELENAIGILDKRILEMKVLELTYHFCENCGKVAFFSFLLFRGSVTTFV